MTEGDVAVTPAAGQEPACRGSRPAAGPRTGTAWRRCCHDAGMPRYEYLHLVRETSSNKKEYEARTGTDDPVEFAYRLTWQIFGPDAGTEPDEELDGEHVLFYTVLNRLGAQGWALVTRTPRNVALSFHEHLYGDVSFPALESYVLMREVT